MAIKLTERQSQILQLIRQAIVQGGRPPTRAEIAQELGFRSANAAEDHLRALQRKGFIKLSANTSRGIQLTALATGTPSQTPAEQSAPHHRLGISGGAGHSGSRLLALPVVGRVAAGSPILATEHIEQEIPIDPQLFARQPDYLLRVRGNSMIQAGILDGDLLAVQRSPEARHGQIVVARLASEVTVKRLSRHGSQITLLPENPDYSAIEISPTDDFSIEGIAVGLIRNTPLH